MLNIWNNSSTYQNYKYIFQLRNYAAKCPISKDYKLRWAIAPVSHIGSDFAVALRTLPRKHHELIAVHACFLSQLEPFAKKFGVPKVFTGINDLANCKDINAVYVCSSNPFHKELAMMMMEHGKHVLCEIPMAINESETRELIRTSHMKEVFLMEAMWSRFLPSYQYIKDQILGCAVGDVKEINCSMGFQMQGVDRMVRRNLGGGALLNLGIYCIQLAQWIYRMPPVKTSAKAELNSDGVDVKCDLEIDYGCGRTAHACISSKDDYENKACITGCNGTLSIPNFICPNKIIDTEGKEIQFAMPATSMELNFRDRTGLAFQAEEMRQCIIGERNETELYNHHEMLLIARLRDQIRQKIGVFYDVDKSNNKKRNCKLKK